MLIAAATPVLPHGDGSIRIASGKRGRRPGTYDLPDVTCVDIVALEESVVKVDWERLVNILPLILSVLWILLGTLFYALHDQLAWARALFMSVNVGWSIGWSMEGLSEYDSAWSKLFTIYHTSIGVLFAGVTILYIAQEVGRDKDNWIMQVIKMKELDVAAETEGCWDSFVSLIKVHMPTLRIMFVFLMWFTFGLVWYPLTNPNFSMAKNVDLVLSTLTAGGYLTLPSTVDAYQLIVTALYTNIGVPLLTIALGLFMNLLMEAPEEGVVFNKIIAPVTAEEISFMQEFDMEDGDGTMDSKEFVILAVVRIGAVTPHLIIRINERFRQLDRKHKGKIAYDDIIVGRQKGFNSSFEPEPEFEPIRRTSTPFALPLRSSLLNKAYNNQVFMKRAKTVFHPQGSAAAAEVLANIAKINRLAEQARLGRAAGGYSTHSASSLISSKSSESDDSDDSKESDGDCEDEDEQLERNDIETGNGHECKQVEDSSFETKYHTSGRVCSSPLVPNAGNNKGSSSLMITKPKSRKIFPEHVSPIEPDTDNVIPFENILMIREESVCLSSRDEQDFTECCRENEREDCNSGSDVSSIMENGNQNDVQFFENGDGADQEDRQQDAWFSPEAKAKMKATVKKQRRLSQGLVGFGHSGNSAGNKYAVKSKKHEGLEQAKKKRRQSKRESAINSSRGVWELRLLALKKILTSPYALAFYLWSLWLIVGTIFFFFEENLTFCEALFVSTSIGYGIFWYDHTSTTTYSKVFCSCHFLIGVLAVSFAMAVFARSLLSMRKDWFEDAKQLRLMRAALATEGRWDDVVTYFDYYWPKVYVHVFFVFWVILGIVWGVCSVQWSGLDAWLFAMTAMAKGGLISLPSSGVHQWDYVFYSLYIVVGAPLMALSCGTVANAISNFAHAQQKEKKLNAAMTEDELVMLKHLGVEDNDGYIHNAEFTILVLVRIGALKANLIEVLLDRFQEIDRVGNGNVSYSALQSMKSFMGHSSSSSLPQSFKSSLKGSFKKSLKKSFSGSFRRKGSVS